MAVYKLYRLEAKGMDWVRLWVRSNLGLKYIYTLICRWDGLMHSNGVAKYFYTLLLCKKMVIGTYSMAGSYFVPNEPGHKEV